MNKDNTKFLFDKYPKIFKGKDLPISQNLMPFGFECGDGWFMLIDVLCHKLQWDTDYNKQPQVVASQVKEKYGGLIFYINNGNNEQYAQIDLIESVSYKICEECGSTDDVQQSTGWVYTRCKKCRGG